MSTLPMAPWQNHIHSKIITSNRCQTEYMSDLELNLVKEAKLYFLVTFEVFETAFVIFTIQMFAHHKNILN